MRNFLFSNSTAESLTWRVGRIGTEKFSLQAFPRPTQILGCLAGVLVIQLSMGLYEAKQRRIYRYALRHDDNYMTGRGCVCLTLDFSSALYCFTACCLVSELRCCLRLDAFLAHLRSTAVPGNGWSQKWGRMNEQGRPGWVG